MWLLLLFYRLCRHRRRTSYAKALKICKAIVILCSAWLLLFFASWLLEYSSLSSTSFFLPSLANANDLASCCYQHRWIKLNEKYITRCLIEISPSLPPPCWTLLRFADCTMCPSSPRCQLRLHWRLPSRCSQSNQPNLSYALDPHAQPTCQFNCPSVCLSASPLVCSPVSQTLLSSQPVNIYNES